MLDDWRGPGRRLWLRIQELDDDVHIAGFLAVARHCAYRPQIAELVVERADVRVVQQLVAQVA
jgi:hypothetical protein